MNNADVERNIEIVKKVKSTHPYINEARTIESSAVFLFYNRDIERNFGVGKNVPSTSHNNNESGTTESL